MHQCAVSNGELVKPGHHIVIVVEFLVFLDENSFNACVIV